MEDTGQDQSVLIITGMHRSGTSLAASLLQSSGVFIGDHLMEGGTGNLKGHFEDWDFVDLHRDCLTAQGVNREGWTTQTNFSFEGEYLTRAKSLIAARSSYAIWGWKDPRSTLFLHAWRQLIPQAKFVFIYRSPWDVVDSLFRRGDAIFKTNPEIAIKTWISYNQKILQFCSQAKAPCLLLRIEDVMQHSQFVTNAINHQLGLDLPAPQNLYDDALSQFSNTNWRRAALIQQYYPAAYELYSQLQQQAKLAPQLSISTIAPEQPIWLLRNWLQQPLVKVRSLKSWYQLRLTASKK